MASSAAHGPLDPSRPAKFPVHLGKSFTKSEGSKRVSSIKYNHRPKQTYGKRATIITESAGGPDDYNLSITDEDEDTLNKYQYHGRRRPQSTSCALIFDPESQTFTLERVDSVFTFNLTSTPQETHAKKLQKQYPQLELDEPMTADQDDDLFGENDDLPEADNPFDYRHFLSAGINGITTADTPLPSTTATPRAQSPASTPKPSAQPKPAADAARKRKQTDRPPSSSTTPAPAARPPKKDVPRVHLQRRASNKSQKHLSTGKHALHKNDDDIDMDSDNDGGLIIEMDDAPPSRKKPLRADLRGRPPPSAPISLRAAASSRSPAARGAVRSPPPRSQQQQQVLESDVDDDSAGEEADSLGILHRGGQGRMPSGAATAAVAAVAAAAMPAGGEEKDEDEDDDEDALEAELEHAFESQEEEEEEGEGMEGGMMEVSNGTGGAAALQEDDAESEEE